MPDAAPLSTLDAGSRARVLLATALALAPLLLLLPVPAALADAGVALAVMALSWRRPLPGWLRLLLALAMLAVVAATMGTRMGRDTGCALLAAMLAIKPAETASLRDARSLLGFALFAPFAAFLLDQGPLTLVLGLAAAIAVLLGLQRLADAEAQRPPAALGPQLRAIGKLAAFGLPLTLAAFWLFPRMATPLWGVPERAVAKPGLSDRMSPGGWLDLMNDDSPALRVQFLGAVPPPAQRYWRGPVLYDFDGNTWQQARDLDAGPPATVTAAAPGWDYRIEVEPTERRQLVALDLPTAAPDGSRMLAGRSLLAERPLVSVTRWNLHSARPTGFQATLPGNVRLRALRLPPGRNPRTLALGRTWRAEAGRDDEAIVRRALAMIHAGFAYTLATPPAGINEVDDFLFERKAGYCEHFSSAFVVLMRAAGIPARVVTGYAGGVRNPLGGYWLVRQSDAHAWAEVWLAGRGWVRVDPTAAVAPERVYDTLADRAGAADDNGFGSGIGELSRWAAGSDWLRRGWNDFVLGFDASRQQRLLRPLGIDKLQPEHLVGLFAALAALLLAGMLWWLARGERERDPLLRAWHRLGRRYARLGLARQPHETAGDWAARVVAARPQEAGLIPLSRRFAESRYAHVEPEAVGALLRDLRRHRPRSSRSPS